MAWQHTPYTIPLLVGASIHLVVLVYLLTHRSVYERVPGSWTASLLLVASTVWLLTYAFELASSDLASKIIWNKAQYVGSALIPVLMFMYVLQYTGHERFYSRRVFTGLSVVPLLTLLLAITNDVHNLIWRHVTLISTGEYTVLINYHGVGFWLYVAYTYLLVLAGVSLLVVRFIRSRGFYRWQTGGLLVGSLAPAVGGFLYVSGLNPAPYLNVPVLSFVITSLFVGWSVFRHHLFSITPVARDTVIEEMDEAVLVLNEYDRVVDVNAAARALIGAGDATIVGEPIQTVWPEHADSMLREHGETSREELEVETPTEQRHLECRITPLHNRDERRVGKLVVLRDVTHRQRRERELRRKNEQLEEFASVLSHDLRNPLSIARGYLDLAREGDDQAFDRIENAHERIDRIIGDMLTLARHGNTVVEIESVDLGTVATEAWASVDTPSATLDVIETMTVDADRNRLLQLFENLFANAVEHGGSDVTIAIGQTESGFFVEDDGQGIPERTRTDVFTYGYSSQPDGTGLGLSIVKNIVDAHGWSIGVDESAAGGARFEIDCR